MSAWLGSCVARVLRPRTAWFVVRYRTAMFKCSPIAHVIRRTAFGRVWEAWAVHRVRAMCAFQRSESVTWFVRECVLMITVPNASYHICVSRICFCKYMSRTYLHVPQQSDVPHRCAASALSRIFGARAKDFLPSLHRLVEWHFQCRSHSRDA